jgi:tRNA pseudouridine55 synthase
MMARRRKGDPVHGWVVLDKPYGLGSTEAVTRVRRLFNARKAGHAGTLDPLASGVLPIALGEATKTVPHLMDAAKSYRFTVAWGAGTTTDDGEGTVTETSDVRPSPDEVTAALPRFTGEIQQVPPAFSALKVAGERAYDIARAGDAVELQARTVMIHAARLAGTPDRDHAEIEIDCGKGTYVRALARDLARALGTCGHVAELRRTRVGPFAEATAVTLAELEELVYEGRGSEALLPVETALDGIPALALAPEEAFALKQGRSVVLLPRQVETLRPQFSEGSRTVSAVSDRGLVALCEMRAGRLNPVRVFNLDAGD